MNINLIPCKIFNKIFFSFVLLSAFCLAQTAKAEFVSNADNEEVLVSLLVQGVGSAEIPIIIIGNDIYLPITDIFNFIKIKNTTSHNLDTISGFFITSDSLYSIDRTTNTITNSGKITKLKSNDIISTETNVYLKSAYFEEIFNLSCSFNFRSLCVTINTKLDLPIIREIRQEQLRKNLNRLKGEPPVDTTFYKAFNYFDIGFFDWNISLFEQSKYPGVAKTNLTLGFSSLGGESKINLNSYINQAITSDNLTYNWRYADNSNSIFKQLNIGKLSSISLSTINGPILGAQITNSPTSFRRSFGSYEMTGNTEPGRVVELYVSNVLVDFVKTDASGFYRFNVPIVYGTSDVKLKFYGAWGEEKSITESIVIPYNFLPINEYEYSITAGKTIYNKDDYFSRSTLNYGVSQRLTVGSGLEYHAKNKGEKFIPFVNSSFSLTPGMLFNAEYYLGVKYKNILSYRLPSDLQFDLSYISYEKNQKAILTMNSKEYKFSTSFPIKFSNNSLYTRFSINKVELISSNYTTSELVFSGAILGINANITTNGFFINNDFLNLYGLFAFSRMIGNGIIYRPKFQYDYTNKKFISIRNEFEKNFSGVGNCNISIENNIATKSTAFQVSFNAELPYFQSSTLLRNEDKVNAFSQTLSGGFVYDDTFDYFKANNKSNVGKGALVFLAFLDINCNDRRDDDEPIVPDIQFHISSGRIEKCLSDSTTRVYDLEAYSSNYVEFSKTNFDNISWRIQKPNISVIAEPNIFKLIQIPISVVGEISGTVQLKKPGQTKGLARIRILIKNENGVVVNKILSETDGYFSYLGLIPGKYYICLDEKQLSELKLTSSKLKFPIYIAAMRDGDVVDDINFTLELNQ